ncbi:hypothetical protein EDD11_001137 [Mortierella claussenii]|nr:hypothetical protein EDD11_001137 [Mortierella claussenii]
MDALDSVINELRVEQDTALNSSFPFSASPLYPNTEAFNHCHSVSTVYHQPFKQYMISHHGSSSDSPLIDFLSDNHSQAQSTQTNASGQPLTAHHSEAPSNYEPDSVGVAISGKRSLGETTLHFDCETYQTHGEHPRFLATQSMESSTTNSDTEDEDFMTPVSVSVTECTNCGTKTTPLWRRDEKGSPLCNACGLFLKLHGRVRPLSLKTDVIKKRNRGGLNSKAGKKTVDEKEIVSGGASTGQAGMGQQQHKRNSDASEGRQELDVDMGTEDAKSKNILDP